MHDGTEIKPVAFWGQKVKVQGHGGGIKYTGNSR